ncbi:hypothetical protein C1H46_022509 [Malus baccata]|uniref:Uncharacterized protein n=1 Tax=Malus baccata TaxID=106549 RepID=A0A540LZI8_MALBA|nr:hypothetical protein C1H46_022509 [Malus baccata]
MACIEAIQQKNNFNLAKALIHFYETRPSAIEKVLSVVKQMKPEIVTVVEQEVNHNDLS